jgi:hypothetical protein
VYGCDIEEIFSSSNEGHFDAIPKEDIGEYEKVDVGAVGGYKYQ